MSNRNVKFLILFILVVLAVGLLVSPAAALGILAGLIIAAYIYQRRYSVVDEIETEWHWYAEQGWKDQPAGEDRPYYSELWRVGVVLVALTAVIVMLIVIL